MRPFLIILGLVLACIALAAYTTHLKPYPADAPLAQRQEEELKAAEKTASKGTGLTDPKNLLSYDSVIQGAIRATMEIEGRGTITLELYPQAAPQTVKRFQELCSQHFFDGLLFHRVEPGFVAQTGDPHSKQFDPKDMRGLTSEQVMTQFDLGHGGSGQKIPLEAKLPHKIYTLGLARNDDPDSGDSQFFINLKDNDDTLDGKYCAFGRIVQGAEIADKIEIGDRIKRFSIP
jgi:peptidyl-prolyl cis-trans isomerase B (cyclophilin B)